MSKKYVFDTNILISAILLRNSIPALAVEKALTKGTIVMSPETIEELMSV
jgi:predicted nucleic acid-binding protein